MGVVCVQALALLLSEDRLAEHLVPHLPTVAALLVKVTQSSMAGHLDSNHVVHSTTLTIYLSTRNPYCYYFTHPFPLVYSISLQASQACPSLPAHGRQSALQGLLTLASLPDRLTPQVRRNVSGRVSDD